MIDNWLAVLVAAVSGFLVGGLWYGPLFGKAWMAERGFTEEDAKSAPMARIYGGAFALNLVSAIFLAHLLRHFATGWNEVMMISSGVALGFIIPAIGTNYLFSLASMKLFLIDAGYWLVFYLAMGLVFGLLG